MDKVSDDRPGTKPSPGPMELTARCTAAAAVLGDYKAELASALLARPPGREWMLRLASVLEGLLAALDEQADDDGTEPYCTACGSWIGMFYGLEGWHHFQGDPAPGGERQLFAAGHEAVPAWLMPPGRELSPADVAVIRKALADAVAHRSARATGCPDCAAAPGGCADHRDDASCAAGYEAQLRRLVTGQEA